MLPAPPTPKFEHLDDYVQQLERNQNMAYDAARQALGKAVKAQKKNYDRFHNLNRYNTGDVIMLKNHNPPEPSTKKFKEKFLGPFYVLESLSDINFRVVRGKNYTPRIVHHDSMEKLDMDREPEDLTWVYDMSKEFKERRAATLTDVTKSMADVMRRLREVENQVGDFRTKTGRIRRRHERGAAKKKRKQVSARTTNEPRRDDVARQDCDKPLSPELRVDPTAIQDAGALLFEEQLHEGAVSDDSKLSSAHLNEDESALSANNADVALPSEDEQTVVQPSPSPPTVQHKHSKASPIRRRTTRKPPKIKKTVQKRVTRSTTLQQKLKTGKHKQPPQPHTGPRRSARPQKPKMRVDM
jgi:hypothetical protein